jgi:hypothetical protein
MDNDLRINGGIDRGEPFTIFINGKPVVAYPGETIATVLLAAGLIKFRNTEISGQPRGMFCGMGLCFDCMVTCNGLANVRACETLTQPGDRVER